MIGRFKSRRQFGKWQGVLAARITKPTRGQIHSYFEKMGRSTVDEQSMGA
jgi:hypothetical protein